MTCEYYPEEIGNTLIELAYKEGTDKQFLDLVDVLYQLKAHAENPYNADYWVTLWRTLELLADKYPAQNERDYNKLEQKRYEERRKKSMSSYLTALKTTTHFMEKDAPDILRRIKKAADKFCDTSVYGWKPQIDKAETLEDIGDALNIQVYYTEGTSIVPILNGTYHSAFLVDLAKAVAPYMSNGYIEGYDSDTGKFRCVFKNGEFKRTIRFGKRWNKNDKIKETEELPFY